MVKLFCAIVGEGSTFEVKIDNTESVSALQKVIAADQEFDFAASKLQLFLATTEENGWLTYDKDLVNKLLLNRVDTSKLKTLWPTWKLNRAKDPPLFGEDVLLGEDVVHVLVRLLGEQSVSSRTRLYSEIEDQKSMKRLKTTEVDKWEWKEEEPVYSRDSLFFVNRGREGGEGPHRISQTKFQSGEKTIWPNIGHSAFGQCVWTRKVEIWSRVYSEMSVAKA